MRAIHVRYLRLGDLYTQVWFRIGLHIAFNMLLETAFTGCFMRGIYTFEQNV